MNKRDEQAIGTINRAMPNGITVEGAKAFMDRIEGNRGKAAPSVITITLYARILTNMLKDAGFDTSEFERHVENIPVAWNPRIDVQRAMQCQHRIERWQWNAGLDIHERTATVLWALFGIPTTIIGRMLRSDVIVDMEGEPTMTLRVPYKKTSERRRQYRTKVSQFVALLFQQVKDRAGESPFLFGEEKTYYLINTMIDRCWRK